MRLKKGLVTGTLVTCALAFSLPAKSYDDSQESGATAKKPGKLSHLMMFHKSAKKDQATETKAQAPAKADVRRHTDGFPEADKKGESYQPQHEAVWWGDSVWKTEANQAAWKQGDAK